MPTFACFDVPTFDDDTGEEGVFRMPARYIVIDQDFFPEFRANALQALGGLMGEW